MSKAPITVTIKARRKTPRKRLEGKRFTKIPWWRRLFAWGWRRNVVHIPPGYIYRGYRLGDREYEEVIPKELHPRAGGEES